LRSSSQSRTRERREDRERRWRVLITEGWVGGRVWEEGAAVVVGIEIDMVDY
jgi:hypothetical protein